MLRLYMFGETDECLLFCFRKQRRPLPLNFRLSANVGGFDCQRACAPLAQSLRLIEIRGGVSYQVTSGVIKRDLCAYFIITTVKNP